MAEFKWISLFLIALLQFTAAAGNLLLSFTVRAGDEVTLPCESLIDGQQRCDGTTWIFSDSGKTGTAELIDLGKIDETAKAKSDRLSVTASCSLVIKKVTAEDAGRYTCRQFRSGEQQGPDSVVHLSVIISEDTTTATTEPTTTATTELTRTSDNSRKAGDKQTAATKSARTTENSPKSGTTTTATSDTNLKEFPDWVKFLIVAVGSAALLIIVAAVIRWKRTEGNKTRKNDSVVQGKDDDGEGDAVHYIALKASSTDPSNLYATIN